MHTIQVTASENPLKRTFVLLWVASQKPCLIQQQASCAMCQRHMTLKNVRWGIKCRILQLLMTKTIPKKATQQEEKTDQSPFLSSLLVALRFCCANFSHNARPKSPTINSSWIAFFKECRNLLLTIFLSEYAICGWLRYAYSSIAHLSFLSLSALQQHQRVTFTFLIISLIYSRLFY